MGGTAGEQIHHLSPLQRSKSADQVSITGHPGGLVALDGGAEMLPRLGKLSISEGEKVEALIQPAGEPLLQVRVTEQGQQRW